jgi:hypothetical protein
MIGAAVAGLLLLKVFPSQGCWRLMLVAGAIPAGMVLVFRIGVPESAWRCLRQGKIAEARSMRLPGARLSILGQD